MDASTASSQEVFGVLRTRMEGQKVDRLAPIFALTDPSLLCKAEKKQVRHALRASTAVQMYAALNGCWSELFFTLIR